MKKLLPLIALIPILFACSNQMEILIDDSIEENSHKLQIRSEKQAIEIANNVLSSSNIGSRTNDNHLTIKGVVDVIRSDFSRSNTIDTLIYALDIENNNGFVLVAAPLNVDPILAIIDSGSFNDTQNLENASYQLMLNATKDYVISISSNDIPKFQDPIVRPDFRIPEIVDEYSIKIIQEPLVKVEWHQSWPENIYCSNNIAGCTPIAMAQILSYFELPKSISYTFAEKDINSENLNWATIKQHKRAFECNCTYSTHLSLARLIREIGQRVNTDYSGSNASGTNFFNVPNAIQSLCGLVPDTNGKSTTSLFAALSNNNGIAIVGNVGHSFIADAIKHLKYKTVEYLFNLDGSLDSYQVLGEYDIRLIHYNWGWGGNCNGYFHYETLEPKQAYQNDYDNPELSNSATYEFSSQDLYYYLYKSQH